MNRYDNDRTIHIALCAGRHDIKDVRGNTIDSAVFETITDPMDFNWIEIMADRWLRDTHITTGFIMGSGEQPTICLYVTGLTPALTSFIKQAQFWEYPIVLFHYNRATETYDSQHFSGSHVPVIGSWGYPDCESCLIKGLPLCLCTQKLGDDEE
jgi:hypothetical protein